MPRPPAESWDDDDEETPNTDIIYEEGLPPSIQRDTFWLTYEPDDEDIDW